MPLRRTFLALGITTFAVLVVACGSGTPRRGVGTNPGDPQLADDETQAAREKIIRRAMGSNVITKIKPEQDHYLVIVDAVRFGRLDFEEKAKLMNIVAAYEYRVPPNESLGTGEVLFIMDSKTGKEIGRYRSSGLILD
jgi:hypothetical protein